MVDEKTTPKDILDWAKIKYPAISMYTADVRRTGYEDYVQGRIDERRKVLNSIKDIASGVAFMAEYWCDHQPNEITPQMAYIAGAQLQRSKNLEFADWLDEQGLYSFRIGDGKEKRWCKSIPANDNPIYTIHELFEQFLNCVQ